MNSYRIAVYIRLSQADEETGKKKDESNSVAHQRLLLNRHLDSNGELSGCPRTEFVDDGFSGTNTDRPAFQKMIRQVRQGDLNLVIVKDFSRFSRDYIETGDYLECVFPFLGVRFISVNDGYDSDRYAGTTGGLDVVMRNIVYAAYSRDLSIKVRTARDQRKRDSQYTDSNVPMGYLRDPKDKHKLVIDEKGAAVIRRIFRMAAGGTKITDIARILNEEGVMTPAQYYRMRNPDTRQDHSVMGNRWSYSSVYIILKRYSYTGALVSNVTLNTAPCSKKRRKQDRDDWIIVKGQHEAIVSEEEFEAAQAIFKKVRKAEKKSLDYPLKSLVRCGCCGRMMKRRIKGYGFECRFKNDSASAGCMTAAFSTEKDLEDLLYHAIMDQIRLVGSKAGEAARIQKRMSSSIQEKMDRLNSLERQIDSIKKDKLQKYEEYAAGNLTREGYLRKKQTADEEIEKRNAAMEECQKELEILEQEKPKQDRIGETAEQFRTETGLTYEMAQAFTEAVFIQSDGTVQIKWKFKDWLPEVDE